MGQDAFRIVGNKIIITTRGRICETQDELLTSKLFTEVVKLSITQLQSKESLLLAIFGKNPINKNSIDVLIHILQYLAKLPLDVITRLVPGSRSFVKDPELLNDYVEFLYNFWRHFDRYIICDSEGDSLDKRPYRTFNDTVNKLANLILGTYRDIQENITGRHPIIYRQVVAGVQIAAISLPKEIEFPASIYKKLGKIPVIRQILMHPPLILNPPMNKRTGNFERIEVNPLERIDIDKNEWLCYPAKVGTLLILIYFHLKFFELGFSLGNLFELASDEDLNQVPDAVYMYGVPGNTLDDLKPLPTVFYDDEVNNMLAGAVPNKDQFGYFGYLKKMVLTLHNIKMMKEGRMPFHGALIQILMKGGVKATVLLMGDTGAGKSETIEAYRTLGEEYIRELKVIADDMGSLEIGPDGKIHGYGTETGAFLRLDDLASGYVFGQVDRAILMNPNQVNTRVVLPVVKYQDVIKGHEIDFILYANNYEEPMDEKPIIERFTKPEQALKVFREGTVMSKGTTTSKGLVHSYFANIFGPLQYQKLHDTIAARFFTAFFNQGLFVGQMRTRLGIPGWEQKGPIEAAKELLKILNTQASS